MQAIKLFLFLATILCQFKIQAQNRSPEFGEFSIEDREMKICLFDPEAEAVKLLDEGKSDYDLYNRLFTTRRVRIKILKSTGIARANISIPFYTKEDNEIIELLDAITYNFDELGNPIPYRLDKKQVFKVKKGEYFSEMKFPMPAVTEGSIIEYKYTVVSKGFAVPDDWIFQDEIPTAKSTFFLDLTRRAAVTYSVQKSPDLPIIEKRDLDSGHVYFEMNNIPAFRREPFMDAERDYIQKVKFQLSGLSYLSGATQRVNTTWKDLAYHLMTEKYFGSQLDKNLKIDELDKMVKQESSDSKKLKIIYDYVVAHFSWNGYYSIYSSDGLKEVADSKKGNAADINLLLVNLLRTHGIEVYPLLAAERSFGRVNPEFPFVDQFNKTIVFAIADGKQFILDATQKNCPAGLTPFEYLNTLAFLVDRKKFKMVTISSPSNSYRNKITIDADLDKDGTVKGTARIESTAYSRQERLNKLQAGQTIFIKEQFENPSKNLTIDSFAISNNHIDSLPFIQAIKYRQYSDRSDSLLFYKHKSVYRFGKKSIYFFRQVNRYKLWLSSLPVA